MNQTPSTLQTPLVKIKETQTNNPPKDTDHHSLQIFLHSISNFNLSFLKTLTLMACLRIITHMEHFIFGMPYEVNFSFPSNGVFGKGAAIESARSSSPVESMAFSQGVAGSGPASPISPAPQINEDMSNQEWSDASDGEEKKAGRMN